MHIGLCQSEFLSWKTIPFLRTRIDIPLILLPSTWIIPQLRYINEDLGKWFVDTLGKRFHVNFLGFAHWFMSIRISQLKDHSISVDQAIYTTSIVAKYLDNSTVKVYKWRSWKVVCWHPGKEIPCKLLRIYFYWKAGSTKLGDPYLSRFPDICSNVSVRLVVRPCLLGSYFNAFNSI